MPPRSAEMEIDEITFVEKMPSRSGEIEIDEIMFAEEIKHLKPIFPLAPSVLWATGFLKSKNFDSSLFLLRIVHLCKVNPFGFT